MVNEDLECELVVIPCGICLRIHKVPRLFAVDCVVHEYCEHDTLFAGALGRALLHRHEAHQEVAL